MNRWKGLFLIGVDTYRETLGEKAITISCLAKLAKLNKLLGMMHILVVERSQILNFIFCFFGGQKEITKNINAKFSHITQLFQPLTAWSPGLFQT